MRIPAIQQEKKEKALLPHRLTWMEIERHWPMAGEDRIQVTQVQVVEAMAGQAAEGAMNFLDGVR